MEKYDTIHLKVCQALNPLGFDCHPFKLGWYNDVVDQGFRLQYHADTLAFCIVSTPDMYENAFLPFVEQLKNNQTKIGRDPIDECNLSCMKKVGELFPEEELEFIQDFELLPNRRPKLLVQTAGHVSGGAYYYRRQDCAIDPWESSKKIFGASLHPDYGGWFAFRGAIIFKGVHVPDMVRKEPAKLLDTDAKVQDFLEKFNYHWKENSFRDVIPVKKRYSEACKMYFDTFPTSARLPLIGLDQAQYHNS